MTAVGHVPLCVVLARRVKAAREKERGGEGKRKRKGMQRQRQRRRRCCVGWGTLREADVPWTLSDKEKLP